MNHRLWMNHKVTLSFIIFKALQKNDCWSSHTPLNPSKATEYCGLLDIRYLYKEKLWQEGTNYFSSVKGSSDVHVREFFYEDLGRSADPWYSTFLLFASCMSFTYTIVVTVPGHFLSTIINAIEAMDRRIDLSAKNWFKMWSLLVNNEIFEFTSEDDANSLPKDNTVYRKRMKCSVNAMNIIDHI